MTPDELIMEELRNIRLILAGELRLQTRAIVRATLMAGRTAYRDRRTREVAEELLDDVYGPDAEADK